MTLPIVICDDSNMARKQMRRSLPADWDVDITFAENGEEAITALEKGLGEVLFLDLTMPVMDGYETLEAIRQAKLDTMIIVVSGDVQEQAYERVMSLGAMDFIKKPAGAETVAELLHTYGIHTQSKNAPDESAFKLDRDVDITMEDMDKPLLELQFDAYREITNIAVGRAGKLLSELLGEFVTLPIPSVNLLEASELQMLLDSATQDSHSVVCQGFIAPGIAGEAFLSIGDSELEKVVEVLNYRDTGNVEVLNDISSILLGAILKGLGEQIHLTFSQACPVVLGEDAKTHVDLQVDDWQQILAIEFSYEVEAKSVYCDVLLMFTEESMATIDQRIV